MWSTPLADSAIATLGGKARGLARLIAAGLPVPEGWVLDARALRALDAEEPPGDLVEEVAARVQALGRAMVRSSATIEDGDAGAAAGVFASREAASLEDVWSAIRAVRASALAPLATHYAQLRGSEPALAVILQRFVDGERVTVYTRPPGAPERDEAWVQRNGEIAKLPRGASDPAVALAVRAERAIGAERGADVELVIGAGAWIVQARPIVHPVRRARVPPPPPVIAALVADGRRWAWDVAHNPDPLSVAQASLVELVDRAAIAPWSMRVCAGFLYTASRAPADSAAPPRIRRAELADRVRALEPRIEATLVDAGAGLDAALAQYLAFYEIWAREVVPLIAAARATAPARSGELRGARPSAIEAALFAAARGELTEREVIARFGAMSPVWDVAAPTFAERPAVVRDAIERTRLLAIAAPEIDGSDDIDDDAARGGADLAERDDVWFARAQWLVRKALLDRAAQLDLADEDVFWLALDELRGAHLLDRDDAHRRARAARTAAARASAWSMPLVIGGASPAGQPLRGAGFGGAVTGRVRRFASLASASSVGRTDVVVTRAVPPALAVFVTGCAALVSETGSLLDHGASLARELGIACVVGCHDAWSLLDDGMIVTVDGDAGTVVVNES